MVDGWEDGEVAVVVAVVSGTERREIIRGEKTMSNSFCEEWLWPGCKGKIEWPELVGEDGKKAAAIIEEENPQVKAIILPERSIVLQDLLYSRVRVYVDSTGIVTEIPNVG